MRILLTGASGFTGLHFGQLAKQHGHEVVDCPVDLTDASAVKRVIECTGPCDALVHLAAISFVGHADESAFYGVNTVGTTNLLKAFDALPASARPRKLLLASSANVYGNCLQSPISENQPTAPVNHYAASKLAMEQVAHIGDVIADDHHFVQMTTTFGGKRIVDWLAGDQLPRIC